MNLLFISGWGGLVQALSPLKQALEQYGYDIELIDFFNPFNDQQLKYFQQYSQSFDVFLGWSLGGQLATLLTNFAQQQGKHPLLITLASNPCFVQTDQYITAMSQATFSTFQEAFITQPDKTLKRFCHLVTKGDTLATDITKHLISIQQQYLHHHPSTQMPIQHLTEGLTCLQRLNTLSILNHLTTPQYHILAEEDALVPKPLFQALPITAKIDIIAHAGHALPYSFAQQLADRIHQFIYQKSHDIA